MGKANRLPPGRWRAGRLTAGSKEEFNSIMLGIEKELKNDGH